MRPFSTESDIKNFSASDTCQVGSAYPSAANFNGSSYKAGLGTKMLSRTRALIWYIICLPTRPGWPTRWVGKMMFGQIFGGLTSIIANYSATRQGNHEIFVVF